jgi:DNA-binding CsgD family transcriptional regulator
MMQTNEESRAADASARDMLPIRGREAEQAAVTAALGRVTTGRSAVVVVRGRPGVGKTRLLEDAIVRAAAAELRVAVVRADRDSHLIPLAPVLDAFGAGDEPISDRDRLRTIALDPEARYWLLQQLRQDLERAATDSGVAVVVDDLQWCDTSTLAMLRSLSSTLADVPVLWVVAVRSGELDPPVSDTVGHLAGRGELLDLEPLGDDAAADMVRDLLGARPDERILEATRRADNVPLLLVELVRGLVDEGYVTVRDGVAHMPTAALPVRFGASVRENVRRLSGRTQHVVQVGAILGRSFPVAALAAMLDAPVQQLLPSIQEAIDAGVLLDEGDRCAFAHDVVREVAESLIPTAVRDTLIRQAAAELLRRGVEPLAVAARIAEVAEPGDEGAADLLRAAARDLAETDATRAGDLALRAADLARNTPLLPEIVVDVVPLLWQSGRVEDVRALLESVDGRLGVEDQARIDLTTARLQSGASQPDALRTIDRALASPSPSALRSRLLALRALNLAFAAEPDELRRTLRDARAVIAAEPESAAAATIEASESVLAFNECRFADASALITAAMRRVASSSEVASVDWLPEGLWAAFLANALGDTERAERIAEANVIETRGGRLARPMTSWMLVRSRVLLDQGRLDDAKTLAESVLDRADELELGRLVDVTAGAVLFRVAIARADRAGMDAHRQFAERLSVSDGLQRAGRWLLALEAEATGDLDRAADLTNDAFDTLEVPVASMSSPADFADDVRLVRMSMRAGLRSRLATIERVARRRAEQNPENDLCAGIALHVSGLVHASPDDLREAILRLRGVRRSLVLASALEDYGTLVRGDDPRAATDAWQEAADLYGEASATRDTERVRRRLRGVGVLVRSSPADGTPAGLTAREQQVAERIAAGLTTDQIADDLFISAHTVVSHVRHVYTKWGVSSRRELAGRYNRERGG